jgi:hypothetical protein
MSEKICYKCNQMVGRNLEGKWIYYRKIFFEKKNVCYNCDFICYPIDYSIWKCNGCEKYNNREIEFCDSITSYCIPCLTKYRESTNIDLTCDCPICSEINNSFNFIPK